MKREKVFYFKKQRNLDSIREVEVSNYEEAMDKESCVEYEGKRLRISHEETAKKNIRGYISVSSKKNKYEKQSLENVHSAIDGNIAIHKKKGANDSIVGYVKINCDTYAIVKKSHLGIIWLFILVGIIGIGGFYILSNIPAISEAEEEIEKEEPEDTIIADGKGTGSLDGDEEKTSYSSEGFRFKINTSPIISDGKMNVRIESPEAENSEFVAVYDYYINAKVDVNYNIIEQYDEPLNIYTSPEIYGNENLEYATINTPMEDGYYTGVCYCSIYDTEGNYLMTNGAVLKIYCAD